MPLLNLLAFDVGPSREVPFPFAFRFGGILIRAVYWDLEIIADPSLMSYNINRFL